MKRFAVLALILATAAVGYATVGDRFELSLFDVFRTNQSLPALRTQKLPFRYPSHLWRKGVEGEVVLRVHITPAGSVDSVVLERSSGNPELDTLAMGGAKDLRYHPARQGETAVAVWAQLPVRFERQRRGSPGEGADR